MSRCAHDQSTYELHRLPICSRCKEQFQLTMGNYESKNGTVGKTQEEWECPKCGKVVPKNLLREDPLSEQDKRLHEWCMNEQKKRRKIKGKQRYR